MEYSVAAGCSNVSIEERDAGEGGAGAPPEVNETNHAPDRAREYRNEEIAVRWYARRCIHSAECIRRAPGVFDPRRRPWIILENGAVEQIMRAVDACPTGALEYVRPDGSTVQPEENSVRMVPGGPLYVRGSITITDEEGKVIREATRVALCRCGKTKNQPFCDNSHRAQ